ncbi:hypothetical protein AKO1_007494 [Acrasis kona]|uniref:Uncharacterized protein n=1 Tax=Acrasis kona TaxID=1008807 RepID=A0AAW2YS94_9EUKA
MLPMPSMSLNIPRKSVQTFIVRFNILQVGGLLTMYNNPVNAGALSLKCTTKDEDSDKTIVVNLLSDKTKWKYDQAEKKWKVSLDKQLEFDTDFARWGLDYKTNPCRLELHNTDYDVHLQGIMDLSSIAKNQDSIKSIIFDSLKSGDDDVCEMRVFVTLVKSDIPRLSRFSPIQRRSLPSATTLNRAREETI